MIYYINGVAYEAPELTEEQLTKIKNKKEAQIEAYWKTVSYDDAVEAEIAKKYSIGKELAIQRQKNEKIEEYEVYYNYCEQCKSYVKEQFSKYDRVGELE